MQTATSMQPTRARITDRGRAPAAKLAPTMIEKATAAAGAMWVMDWNRTSLSPIASRARPGDGLLCATARLLLGGDLPPRQPPRTVYRRRAGNQAGPGRAATSGARGARFSACAAAAR